MDAEKIVEKILDAYYPEEGGSIKDNKARAVAIIRSAMDGLLDEAAERAVAWWDNVEGKIPKIFADELRAAVRGEVE